MLQLVVPQNKTIKILINSDGLNDDYQMRDVVVQNILYIARIKRDFKNNNGNRDFKKIVFSTPIVIDKKEYFETTWKTRDSLHKILTVLNYDPNTNENKPFFVQINSNVLARSIFISGRDSEWKHIQLTGVNYLKQTYKPIELPIGMDFKPQIKIIFNLFHAVNVSNSFKGDKPDIIYINPYDIIYIVSKKRSKTIFLAKPFIKTNKPCFELNWNTNFSANQIIDKFADLIIQVDRNLLVNVSSILNSESMFVSKTVEIRMQDKSINKIPISKDYIDKIQ